jgi:hypothetical protein
MIKLMHYKEDTSKPENRVNITLFHLLMINDLRGFIFSKLQLDDGCIIYPAPNLETEEFATTDRPDFKIEKNGQLVGYIEVELGKDIEQVKKYDSKTPVNIRIYTIFGKQSDGGNLSLEEIYYYLKSIQNGIPHNTQIYWSVNLLLNLIKYYVIDGNFHSNNKRVSISENMRNTLLIETIYEKIGAENILEAGKIEKGKILLNTVGEGGFSLRVFSRVATDNSFSLMNRTGGREIIYFPSYTKLRKYISNQRFVEEYTNLLETIGCTDIKEIGESQRTSLHLKQVENNIHNIIDIIKLLL